MIYAIIALAVMVLVLYACGCFITRAILKATETTDKDDLYPVLCCAGPGSLLQPLAN